MIKRYSAFVLLSVLLATTASAQDCSAVAQQLQSGRQEIQSAQDANSVAATEYSSCAQKRGRESCKDEYSKLESAQRNLETAISVYESNRQSECVQQPGVPFGRARPLGVWPPATAPQ